MVIIKERGCFARQKTSDANFTEVKGKKRKVTRLNAELAEYTEKKRGNIATPTKQIVG